MGCWGDSISQGNNKKNMKSVVTPFSSASKFHDFSIIKPSVSYKIDQAKKSLLGMADWDWGDSWELPMIASIS